MKHDLVQPEILLTEEELVMDVRSRMVKRGDQGKVAVQLGVQQSELSAVLGGRARLRPGLLSALGYRRVIRFERVD